MNFRDWLHNTLHAPAALKDFRTEMLAHCLVRAQCSHSHSCAHLSPLHTEKKGQLLVATSLSDKTWILKIVEKQFRNWRIIKSQSWSQQQQSRVLKDFIWQKQNFQQKMHCTTVTTTKTGTNDRVSCSVRVSSTGKRKSLFLVNSVMYKETAKIVFSQQPTLQIFYLHSILEHNRQLCPKSLSFAPWAASHSKQRNTAIILY